MHMWGEYTRAIRKDINEIESQTDRNLGQSIVKIWN